MWINLVSGNHRLRTSPDATRENLRRLLTSPEHSTHQPGPWLALLQRRFNQEILAKVVHGDQTNQAPVMNHRHGMAIAFLQTLEYDLQHLRWFSDQELVAQLASQARELGIEVDLTYRFGGQ